MGAGAFLLHLTTTLATTIAVVWVALVTPDGKGDVGYQQEITNVIECEDAEHHIDDGTNGSKTGEIKQGIKGGQLVTDIVEDCHSHNDDRPYGGHEES